MTRLWASTTGSVLASRVGTPSFLVSTWHRPGRQSRPPTSACTRLPMRGWGAGNSPSGLRGGPMRQKLRMVLSCGAADTGNGQGRGQESCIPTDQSWGPVTELGPEGALGLVGVVSRFLSVNPVQLGGASRARSRRIEQPHRPLLATLGQPMGFRGRAGPWELAVPCRAAQWWPVRLAPERVFAFVTQSWTSPPPSPQGLPSAPARLAEGPQAPGGIAVCWQPSAHSLGPVGASDPRPPPP